MTKLAASSLRTARESRGLKSNLVSSRDAGAGNLTGFIWPRVRQLAAPARVHVERLRAGDDLDPLVPHWRDLADYAAEANPFFEEWMLRPALEHLKGANRVQLLAVWEETPVRRLIGLMPVRLRAGYNGLPVRCAEVWKHLHCFLATPLLRKGCETRALGAMIRHLRRQGIWVIRFPQAAADGPFGKALDDLARTRRLAMDVPRLYERAVLRSDLEGEAYIDASISKKKRKEFNRKGRRLAEEGNLEAEVADMTDPACVEGVALEFLELEGSGWKGQRGSAMTCRPREARYFIDICRNAAAQDKLRPFTHRLDDVPISASINFLGGDGLFCFKIAYNEAYAQHSPGVHMELDLLRNILGDKRIAYADSCAQPDHSMINHLWRERRVIRNAVVGTSASVSPLIVSAFGALERFERAARPKAAKLVAAIRRSLP